MKKCHAVGHSAAPSTGEYFGHSNVKDRSAQETAPKCLLPSHLMPLDEVDYAHLVRVHMTPQSYPCFLKWMFLSLSTGRARQ